MRLSIYTWPTSAWYVCPPGAGLPGYIHLGRVVIQFGRTR